MVADKGDYFIFFRLTGGMEGAESENESVERGMSVGVPIRPVGRRKQQAFTRAHGVTVR